MTPKQAAYLKSYYQTPRGREVRANALKKYNATPKGRAARREYQQTGKGRAASKKYCQSYRGILRAAFRRVEIRHLERWPNDPTTLTFPDLIELWRKQEGCCALSGIEMTWGRGSMHATSLSVDRLDNSIGYHLHNIRLVCQAVNAMRGNGSDAEVLAIAKAIVAYAPCF